MCGLDAAKAAAREYMAANLPDRDWFIVGGALRDTTLGRPFKDVDIFISGFPTDPVPEFDQEELETTDPADLAADRNAYLMKAYTINYAGFELNIIYMRTPWTLEGIADRCDFGICQVSWCPKTDTTYHSPQFLYDLGHRTLTNTRTTAAERHDRMQDKFPDFLPRNPRNLPTSSGGWIYKDGQVVRQP